MNLNRINAYQKDNIKTQVASADPYTLIKMLMAGCLERLAKGKGCIERRDLEGKSVHLSKAASILMALDRSLNAELGGEVAQNLSALYQYMVERVNDASLKLQIEPIDEVIELMLEIKAGWDAIPYDEVQNGLNALKQG